VKLITKSLEEMKVKVIHPGLGLMYVPTHESLRQCTELGREIAKAVKENG